ncbi:MAG: hypothetical protein SGCHY_002896 [Lobulomycetales sp.]
MASQGAKRLRKELIELNKEGESTAKNPFIAYPLEDNLFEWHFSIKGPDEAGFQGGIYHGRISFPKDYPFTPPSLYFLTPNGRFEVNKKICLSITNYHPEFWRPAWGVSSALVALIGFMPTPGEGAIGALDYTEEERKALAVASVRWTCSICGKKNSDAFPGSSSKVEAVDKSPAKETGDDSMGNETGDDSTGKAAVDDSTEKNVNKESGKPLAEDTVGAHKDLKAEKGSAFPEKGTATANTVNDVIPPPVKRPPRQASARRAAPPAQQGTQQTSGFKDYFMMAVFVVLSGILFRRLIL